MLKGMSDWGAHARADLSGVGRAQCPLHGLVR